MLHRYVIFHRRSDGTCARRETSAANDRDAREYADVVTRARASYGEELTVDSIHRVEYVPVPLNATAST